MLCTQVDVAKHGVDLFGRDCLVLGRLLATLAGFAECASGTPASVPLASATMELLRAPQVRSSSSLKPLSPSKGSTW